MARPHGLHHDLTGLIDTDHFLFERLCIYVSSTVVPPTERLNVIANRRPTRGKNKNGHCASIICGPLGN